MKTASTSLAVACLLSLAAGSIGVSSACAQRYVDGNWGWGGGYHHASTVQEGAQRGFADIVRSAGQYNLDTAQAASVAQDAASKYLDNRLKGTNTYFQMRQQNRAYRAQEGAAPLTSEQLFRIAHEQAPKTLSNSELDPLTGDITWPLVLQADEYKEYRQELQKLFDQRSSGSGPTSVFQIQSIANQALATLKQNIRNYPAPEYLKAKNFLQSLSFSARAPHL